MTPTDANKEVIKRFNTEVIEQGNLASFTALMDPGFINHSAPAGSNGPEGMIYFFNEILRPALSNLQVAIHSQVAEDDLVTTRKAITGMHTGTFLGVPATNQSVTIDVIDIVRVRNGRYFEHWGITSLPAVLAGLSRQ